MQENSPGIQGQPLERPAQDPPEPLRRLLWKGQEAQPAPDCSTVVRRAGSLMVKVVPFPTSLSNDMEPW